MIAIHVEQKPVWFVCESAETAETNRDVTGNSDDFDLKQVYNCRLSPLLHVCRKYARQKEFSDQVCEKRAGFLKVLGLTAVFKAKDALLEWERILHEQIPLTQRRDCCHRVQ